ncbi:MAG TPA: STN domain-containing protein [Chryseolinea sp.]|nr:STN domain-containing protein [Chryseolinea sp.]
MIIHSQWGVKVASSVCLVFFFVVQTAFSQSASKDVFQKKITLTGQAVSFEEVLRKITSQTKLYFIYSSNLVEANKNVSLTVKERPLLEVLEILSQQMNFSFRKEGTYIVLKRGPAIKNNVAQKKSSIQIRPSSYQSKIFSQENNLTVLENTGTTLRNNSNQRESYSSSIPYGMLQNNLLRCPSTFFSKDSLGFKRYYPLAITNPHPRRYGFTAIRFIANEYSGGIEIHVGMPALYGVVNAGLMAEGYLRNGFGVGTSIPIKQVLSLNPIYTFATLKREEDFVIDETLNIAVPDGLKLTGRHHQLKLMLQFPASKKIMFYAGPSFNFLKTSYAYKNVEVVVSNVRIGNAAQSAQYPNYVNPSQGSLVKSIYYSSPPDFTVTKFWVGFEVGASYQIKFSRR